MEDKKSIFSFADKNNYESPFGNWKSNSNNPKSDAKIVSMYVTRDDPKVAFFRHNPPLMQNYVIVPVLVIVVSSKLLSRVKVKCSNGQIIDAKAKFGSAEFEAIFHIKVGRSMVRVDQYAGQNFTFTAELTDIETGKKADPVSRTLKIDTKGVISKADEKKEEHCFCLKQGLVDFSCQGKGKSITDELYGKLAEELGVEKAVFVAIGQKESKSNSFIQENPKKATILLERHYVYRLMKEKYGKTKADSLKTKNPNLCHPSVTTKGNYGTKKEQINRLETVKGWDTEIAIQSCSWGKFQIMGEYYKRPNLYQNVENFENAMNQCEIQQFQYFKSFIVHKRNGQLLSALKAKNWEKIAELYNGKNWKRINPDYAIKLKRYYEDAKGF